MIALKPTENSARRNIKLKHVYELQKQTLTLTFIGVTWLLDSKTWVHHPKNTLTAERYDSEFAEEKEFFLGGSSLNAAAGMPDRPAFL